MRSQDQEKSLLPSAVSAQRSTTQARALELTERLVRCPSYSRTTGELRCASLIDSMLADVGQGQVEHGLYPVPGDPLGRSVVWGLLPGAGARTVVLICHYDTVDTQDYGELEECATRPDELRERMLAAVDRYDASVRAHLSSPEEWLFGRGVVDMKAGVAAYLVVLEELCAQSGSGDELLGNVLFVATPDEEVESAGMLAAVELLRDVSRERGLEYLGAINNDYTTALYGGDETRRLYAGNVGKLLPSIYVRGVETHAGEPYGGYDANLLCSEVVRAVSMVQELADMGEYAAAPPVTLKMSDFKERYDVQVPFEAYAEFNYLTYEFAPEKVLANLMSAAEEALEVAMVRVHMNHIQWQQRAGLPVHPVLPQPRVVSYSELLNLASERTGSEAVHDRLTERNLDLAALSVDPRLRSAHVVRELWNLSGMTGPAVVVYFSPPYYPHALPEEGSVLLRAARRVAEAHGVEYAGPYPYISDSSYLNVADAGDLTALSSNMPLWSDKPSPENYSLPLPEIAALNLECINIGIWGFGAHKRDERLHIPYSCGTVPRMIRETVLETLRG